jgi:hypothetical protein
VDNVAVFGEVEESRNPASIGKSAITVRILGLNRYSVAVMDQGRQSRVKALPNEIVRGPQPIEKSCAVQHSSTRQ